VDGVETIVVDLELGERLARYGERDAPVVPDLREVAYAFQPAVRDARRATGAARDLLRGGGLDLDAEDARGAAHDLLERLGLEQVELVRRAEAVAQRRREPADARRRADEREAWQRKPQRARARPLADDDVELVNVHR